MATPDVTPQPAVTRNIRTADKSGQRYSMETAVRFFTNETSQKKVRGNAALMLAIQEVELTAKRDGLTSDVIGRLIDVAASGSFPDSINSRLIKSLLPSERIPQGAVVKAISWMCTNKPSNDIQALLLKWIILTYDLLDRQDNIHALYGVLFHFIENDVLCPHVCHLLYLLTRLEDVRLFRVHRLVNLQKRVGILPHITGLLSVYKMFCPHLVSLVTPPTQRVYFRQGERAWSAEVDKAKERLGLRETSQQPADVTPSQGRLGVDMGVKAKRKCLDVIPAVNVPSLSVCSKGGTRGDTVSLRHIKSFDDLLTNIDRLELPGQIAAILVSPFLQHVISCQPSQTTMNRLSFWLHQVLHQEILSHFCGVNPRAERLLQTLIDFTDFLHEDIPVCENFLIRYLQTWNGADYRPLILKLITRFRIYPFQKFNDLVLEPLRSLFFQSSVFFKCQVVFTLTELLRNFVSIELQRHADTLHQQTQQKDEETAASARLSIFEVRVDNFEALHTVQELIAYVDRVTSVGLLVEDRHVLLMHFVLEFFELVSCLHLRYGVPYIYVPSSGTFYMALFANNALACSTVCRIICNYRDEFEALKKLLLVGEMDSLFTTNMRDGIQLLNQYILDVSNALWRNKAFSRSGKSVVDIPLKVLQATRVKHINEAFSIHLHMAMLPFACSFLEQTQPKDKRVHPSLIRSAERETYLEFLKRERLDGIVTFINTFIKRSTGNLSTSRAHLTDG